MLLNSCLKCKKKKNTPFFQYLSAFTGALIIVSVGMHLGWSSPSLSKLENSTLEISQDEESWLVAMPFLGSIFGTILGSSLVDILGRKMLLTATTFPFLAAWLMIALWNSLIGFYIARLIAGVANGMAILTSIMYLGEIAEPEIRGFLLSVIPLTVILGYLIITIMGSYLTIVDTAFLSALLPVLGFVSFIWMPKSPYFLVIKERYEEAKKSVQIFRGKDDVDDEMDRIIEAVKAPMKDSGKFLDLFTVKSNRKAVYIILLIQTSYHMTGAMPVSVYSQEIFQATEISISPEIASIILYAIQLVVVSFSSILIDRVGRRPLIIVSLAGSSIMLFAEATCFLLKLHTHLETTALLYLPIVLLIGFIIFISAGMEEIVYVLIGELFPANVKAFALCLALIFFCAMAALTVKVFQIIRDSFGIYVPFYTFSANCVVSLLLVFFFVPETKGANLEEIQEMLGGKSGKKIEKNDETKAIE